MDGTMTPEILFTKDRAANFLNQTIFDPINARKLAPSPEIAQTSVTKQEKEEALTKAIQKIKDSDFSTVEVNSLLKNILNGFARESRGWDRYAIRASLKILPFIGLKTITSAQIAKTYTEAIVTILPSHPETTADGGFRALIEAGMILLPHMSIISKNSIDTQVVPVLRQELKKKHSYTNNELFENLVGQVDNLDNSLKTGLIEPIEIKPKDITEIANKFKEFCKDSLWKHFSPEQFATLDLLVKEAIIDFGMNVMQIREMSGMSVNRINGSIRRLRVSGSILGRRVDEGFLTLQVQELLERGIEMTNAQIAHALGPGITKDMVNHAKRRLIKRGQYKNSNKQSQEKTSLEQDIINLRRQGFSRSQIANQLDKPITRISGLIDKLIQEKKIERKIRTVELNHPIIERAIKIDACVDEMQSNNPGITWKEIANRLRLPIHRVQDSLERLKVYRQIEQLIAQEKTALQIAQEMGIGETKAKFDIARLQRLRDFQSISKTNNA